MGSGIPALAASLAAGTGGSGTPADGGTGGGPGASNAPLVATSAGQSAATATAGSGMDPFETILLPLITAHYQFESGRMGNGVSGFVVLRFSCACGYNDVCSKRNILDICDVG